MPYPENIGEKEGSAALNKITMTKGSAKHIISLHEALFGNLQEESETLQDLSQVSLSHRLETVNHVELHIDISACSSQPHSNYGMHFLL